MRTVKLRWHDSSKIIGVLKKGEKGRRKKRDQNPWILFYPQVSLPVDLVLHIPYDIYSRIFGYFGETPINSRAHLTTDS